MAIWIWNGDYNKNHVSQRGGRRTGAEEPAIHESSPSCWERKMKNTILTQRDPLSWWNTKAVGIGVCSNTWMIRQVKTNTPKHPPTILKQTHSLLNSRTVLGCIWAMWFVWRLKELLMFHSRVFRSVYCVGSKSTKNIGFLKNHKNKWLFVELK